ncbi:MAG: hypothetical protein KY476_09845 [Planctomycetes bacterium]|nr:hypothetical protein [Planctomycetota bacterium]
MSPTEHNADLNELVVGLGRSLLQYADQSWPWASEPEADVRHKVDEFAHRQRRHIENLCELLSEREWAVEFGAFPDRYTDLHYMALEYLLSELAADAERSAVLAESVRDRCVDDPPARALAERVAADEREQARELSELARRRTSSVAS